jgi:hypothetical protein
VVVKRAAVVAAPAAGLAVGPLPLVAEAVRAGAGRGAGAGPGELRHQRIPRGPGLPRSQGAGRVVRVRQGHRRSRLCEPEPPAHDGTWFSDGMTLPRALDLEDTTGAADHPILRGWMQHQVLQRIGPARSGFVELELLCRRQSARSDVDGTRPRRKPHRAVLELVDAVDVPEPHPVRFGVRGSSRGSTSSTRSISRRSRPRPLGPSTYARSNRSTSR